MALMFTPTDHDFATERAEVVDVLTAALERPTLCSTIPEGRLKMEPIKIGWSGSALDGLNGGYDKIHRLAFERAVEQGVLTRPYEFVLHAENGLPNGSARSAIDGFRRLVDEGCIAVAGAYSFDNAMVVGPVANEPEVPLVSWCGTERFSGPYCFRLGNGDCGGDPSLIVGWLKRNGHERVAVLVRSPRMVRSTSGTSVKSAVAAA